MDDFAKNLSSVGWWLSVVAVGVFINLLSAGVAKRTDTFASRASKWWSNRSESKRREYQQELQTLVHAPNLVPYYMHEEVKQRIYALQFLLFTVFFFLASMMTGIVDSSSGPIDVETLESLVPWLRRIFLGVSMFLLMMSAHSIIRAARISGLLLSALKSKERAPADFAR